MHNSVIKNTKNLVILHVFHIRKCLIFEICPQKLNKITLIKHCKYYYKSTNINIIFSSFKVGDLFSIKESVPKHPRSVVVCRFTCPGCNGSYIGEKTCHLTLMKGHLETDSKSHIFKHLSTNRNCEELCDTEFFKIIGSTTSSYRLKLKEVMHITWEKPLLNKQVKYYYNHEVTYFLLFYYCCY